MNTSAGGSGSIYKWLEVSAIVGLIACWLLPLFFYTSLPENIPIHFDVSGQPNGYSTRAGIWGLPAIATFTYVILSVVSKIPLTSPLLHLPASGPEVYALTRRLLQVLKAEIVVLLAIISYLLLQVASGRLTQMPVLMLPLFLISIFGTIAVYFWQVWRQNQT